MSIICQLATMRSRTCGVDIVLLLFAISIRCFAQATPPPQASQPNPDFAAAQTLLQQGKYDEAIAQLQAIWLRRIPG